MEAGSGEERWTQLQELCESILSRRPLILASNRGPVEHRLTSDGRTEVRRGSGGVVTALSSLIQNHEFTWVASAMGEGDRRVAERGGGARIKSPLPGHRVYLRFVVTPRRVYHKYYNVFCNPLLWFLQHYMWNPPYNPNVDLSIYDAWHEGYVLVNEAFARAVVEEAQRSSEEPIVMIHDYHLYLTTGYVRESLPNSIIHHFNHIPWPTPRYWQLIPSQMRIKICASLCSADVVGFQTNDDVRNFLHACEEFLPDTEVDYVQRVVYWADRSTRVRAYPLSINVEEIRRIANSPRTLEYEAKLRPLCNEKTIVRVDRAEPTKNVVRGFKAFNVLLDKHPELRGRVTFLAFLVPSRTHIRQYQRYMDEIQQVIQGINTTFSEDGWQPVVPFFENNYTQAIAGMKLYDVFLVNSMVDGMNLVAKEGPVVNSKAGVLILSESSGAYKQLSEECLSISAADIEGTTEAMYQAIIMEPEERQRRAAALCRTIEQEDISHWLYRQMEDLQELV